MIGLLSEVSVRKIYAWMKALIVPLLALILVACNASASAIESAPASPAQPTYEGKKVLFVNSYHEGYEWSDGIEAGLHSVLDEAGVEMKIVRMDTKRNQEEAFAKEAASIAKDEIEAFKPDVIIAADDNAQKYLIVPYYKNTDLPVIFNGVNWDATIYGYPASNVTGMVEVELPGQLVEQLKPYAEGETVGYLTADSATERKVADIYNDQFFEGEMKVVYVDTFEGFKDEFLKLQKEVDIVFLGNNAGIDEWDIEEAEAFFRVNTTVPTGSINDWLSPYALLTLAKMPEEQGEWSAQAALEILGGKPVAEIPIVQNKRGQLIVNLAVAENLDVSLAPAVLRNAEIYGAE